MTHQIGCTQVYKSFDPRARVMRCVAHEVLEHLNIRCALFSFIVEYYRKVDLAVAAQSRQ